MTQERPPPARPWYEQVVSEIALRGWAKTELSYRSGVARTTIDNWNTNRHKPSAKAVNAVADTLGIDRAKAHVLAGIVAPKDDSRTAEEPEIPPGLLAQIRRTLPAEDQERVIAAIRQTLSPTPPAEEEGSGHSRRAV